MDEDSVTESESQSGSESKWSPESSSGSEWSWDKEKKEQKGEKRKIIAQSGDINEQTGTPLVKKRGGTGKSCESKLNITLQKLWFMEGVH